MKSFIALLVWVLTINPFANVARPKMNELFSLALHPANSPVKAGSELRLSVSVTNISDHDLNFAIAPGATPDQTMSYAVEIRDARGKEPAPTPFLRNQREHPTPVTGSVFGYTLAPGKSYEEQLVITRLYALGPGKYAIRVERSQKPWPNPATNVKSNAISVTIDE